MLVLAPTWLMLGRRDHQSPCEQGVISVMKFSSHLVHQVLDAAPVARLALCDLDDHMQALAFVFVRQGDSLWSPIDGKPKKSAQLSRLRWLQRRPDVCVLLDHYAADWSELWWLRLYARATIVHAEHADWQAAVDALAQKYPQYAETPMFMGEATMIRFDYHDYRGWAASPDFARATSGIATGERSLEG